MLEYRANYDRSTQNSQIVMGYLRDVMRRQVVDLTRDPEAQRDGVDFMVSGRRAEFKDDKSTHRTQNLCFEVVSNIAAGTPGCMLTSKADLLFYYETVTHRCHVMLLPVLRETIDASEQRRWDAYKVSSMLHDGTFAYGTLGLLVPLNTIQQPQYHVMELSAYVQRRRAA